MRRDLWKPFLVCSSTSPVFREDVARGLRQALMSKEQVQQDMSNLYLSRKKRKMEVLQKNTLHQLFNLNQVLHTWERNRLREGKQIPPLTFWWEDLAWNDFTREQLRETQDTDWPAFVEHRQLQFERDRHILNPEIANFPTSNPVADM